MAASTWQWTGSSWILISGSGNPSGGPQSGDTAIIPPGTSLDTGFNPQLTGNTGLLGGTFTVSGDAFTNLGTPTFDSATLIENIFPGQTAAVSAVLNSYGFGFNAGTVLSTGPAGNTLTVNIAATSETFSPTVTQFLPGYFFNTGTMEATAGTSLIINVATQSALFNPGTILANGGYVKVNVDPNAYYGGVAPERGYWEIEGGGTIETQAANAGTVGNNGSRPYFLFLDNTPGNTLKIDNIGSFGGVVSNFFTGDTVDLGTLFAVSTITYDQSTSLLSLKNGSTIVASLVVGNSGVNYATGTFPLVGGAADGFVFTTGADGNTLLTTTSTRIATSNLSGT